MVVPPTPWPRSSSTVPAGAGLVANLATTSPTAAMRPAQPPTGAHGGCAPPRGPVSATARPAAIAHDADRSVTIRPQAGCLGPAWLVERWSDDLRGRREPPCRASDGRITQIVQS